MAQPATEDPRWIGGYRLLGKLGTGGMGSVHLARSEGGRTVAVKRIKAELAAEPEFRARFRLEVEAARRVGERWTAPVLDADTEAETPWVATGYIAGLPLQQAVSGGLEHSGPLPESSVQILAHGLGGALADIHAAGLVHRDLKPSNVLITIDGPRVIDFGIARSVGAVSGNDTTITTTGAIMGSPSFMAPEQILGTGITPASDVFCMGAILAYAATGTAPFGSTGALGAHAVMFRTVQDEPSLDGIEEPLRALIASCLAKDPEERPSPQEIVAATAPPPADTAAEPWLPAGLIAEVGRRAVELLDTDTPPSGAGRPPAPRPSPDGDGDGDGREPTPSFTPSGSEDGTTALPASPPPEPARPARRSRRWLWIPAALALVAGAVTVAAVLGGGLPFSPDEAEGGGTASDVPAGYIGTWSGPVTRDGEPTGQFRRFEITRGTLGEVVANSVSLGVTYECRSDGTLTSAGKALELDTKVVKSVPEDRCSAIGSHTLTREQDGTLTWEAAGRTATLRKVTGTEELPARYDGVWSRPLPDGGTQRLTIDGPEAGSSRGIRLVSAGVTKHCEASAMLFSAGGNNPARIGPPAVDEQSSAGVCSTGNSSLLRVEGDSLIREFPDSGATLTYTHER